MLNNDQYFTGTIVEIVDPVLYHIKVDIPGIASKVPAFPMRGEVDQPRVGDFVLLRSLDPVFKSYYLYQKIKENNYIGFRSNGKMVDITPEYITVAIFDPETVYSDSVRDDSFRPIPTDWLKIDKNGNLEVFLRENSNITITGNSKVTINIDSAVEIIGNSTVKIGGNSDIDITGNSTINVNGNSTVEVSGNSEVNIGADSTLNVGGNSNISVSGNSDINVGGATTLTSPSVTITGGSLTVNGSASGSGPFNCLNNCAFSGVPHSGNVVSGT